MRHALVLSVLALLLAACGSSQLRYRAGELKTWRGRPRIAELDFHTDDGRQTCFYVAPRNEAAPRPLVVIFPGVGSRALDRLDWIDRFRDPDAGYLLIDYAGRGMCEGSLRPSRLPQTFEGALAALGAVTGRPLWDLTADVRLVGHSFGTAAALRFAELLPVRRIVLLAPMTTLRAALFRKIGPLAWFVPDNLDNRKMAAAVLARSPDLMVTILHGEGDDSIPLAMGEELKAVAPERIRLEVVPGGTHTSILTDCADRIEALLFSPEPAAGPPCAGRPDGGGGGA